MDLTTPKWQHDPTRTEADLSEAERIDMAELGMTWDDLHRPTAANGLPRATCLGCWCYSCGGRNDQPRLRRGDDRQGLDDPDSHRWCFE